MPRWFRRLALLDEIQPHEVPSVRREGVPLWLFFAAVIASLLVVAGTTPVPVPA